MKYPILFFLLLYSTFLIGQTNDCDVCIPTVTPSMSHHMHGGALYDNLANSPTYESVKSGIWTNINTWNCISGDCSNYPTPTNGSRVWIHSDHIIRLSTELGENLKLLKIEGELRIAANANTELKSETIQVMPGGVFRIGSANGNYVGEAYHSKITFIHDGFEIDTIYDPERISRGLLTYGDAKIRVYGMGKEAKVLIGDAAKETNEINVLNGIPSTWKIGDDIVIPGTVFEQNEYYELQDEVRKIVNISGNTITVDDPFDFHHQRIKDNSGQFFELHLVNLTRNVIFSTENPESHYSDFATYNRAHIMFMGEGDVLMENVLLKDLGRTNKRIPLDDIDFWNVPEGTCLRTPHNNYQLNQLAQLDSIPCPNGYIYTGNDDTDPQITKGLHLNTRGRYALHFHRNNKSYTKGDLITKIQDKNAAKVKGSVVWGTPGWGFVNHTSYVDFEDNICYDFVGSGFVTESGDEFGSFVRNIAIGGRGNEKYQSVRLVFLNPERPLPLSDFGFSGEGFWFQGPMLKVVDNIASSCNGAGMIWFTTGALDVSNNYFIGIDNEVAKAYYLNEGFQDISANHDSCNPVHDIISSEDWDNKDRFSPRKWKKTCEVFLADLPILECSNFKAYACLAGFRLRFNNGPSNSLFTRFSTNVILGYGGELFPACNFSNRKDAERMHQSISNLRLWNNQIGIRAKYSTNTFIRDVKIVNENRYHLTIPMKGIESDHEIKFYTYCDTDVSGYAFANDILDDFPQDACIFTASFFDSLSCNLNGSILQDHDNFGVFCPIPANIYVSDFSYVNNEITISWDTSGFINRVGIRYKEKDDLYWKYNWGNNGTGNSSTLTGVYQGELYEYQLVGACEDFFDVSDESTYAPYANDGCEIDSLLYPYDKVAKNSYWSENLSFQMPCEDLYTGYSTDNGSTWETSSTNSMIHICHTSPLFLKLSLSDGIALSDLIWENPKGEVINPSWVNSDVLELPSLGQNGYGTYKAIYLTEEGSENECRNEMLFEVKSISGAKIGYEDQAGLFIPSSAAYTCLNNGIRLGFDQANIGSVTWKNQNGSIIFWDSNPQDVYLDISPTNKEMYQTYTAILTDNNNCISEHQITVEPEGDMICLFYQYKEPEIDIGEPIIVWNRSWDCKVYHCGSDDVSIRMHYESRPILSRSTWYYETTLSDVFANPTKATFTIKGSDINSLDFDKFPRIRVPEGSVAYFDSDLPVEIDLGDGLSTITNHLSFTEFLDLSIFGLDGYGTYTTEIYDHAIEDKCKTIRIFEIERDQGCSYTNLGGIRNKEAEDFIPSNKPSLKLYPNPLSSNNILNILFETEEERKDFFIFDSKGQLLKNISIQTSKGTNTSEIDISEFNQDMYFVTDKKGMYGRFIVM